VVTGDGRGGRNQEFVLGAASVHADGLVLSLGTDGVDGSSDAAGALLDEAVITEAARAGLDPESYLTRNDSDRFFGAAGGRLETGPTGTNVADLQLCLRA
jgi:glycerate-2-kinase